METPMSFSYSIRDLERLTGASQRQIRHWIGKGLLRRPLGKGSAAFYLVSHLIRIQEITRLLKQGQPVSKLLPDEAESPEAISARSLGETPRVSTLMEFSVGESVRVTLNPTSSGLPEVEARALLGEIHDAVQRVLSRLHVR